MPYNLQGRSHRVSFVQITNSLFHNYHNAFTKIGHPAYDIRCPLLQTAPRLKYESTSKMRDSHISKSCKLPREFPGGIRQYRNSIIPMQFNLPLSVTAYTTRESFRVSRSDLFNSQIFFSHSTSPILCSVATFYSAKFIIHARGGAR